MAAYLRESETIEELQVRCAEVEREFREMGLSDKYRRDLRDAAMARKRELSGTPIAASHAQKPYASNSQKLASFGGDGIKRNSFVGSDADDVVRESKSPFVRIETKEDLNALLEEKYNHKINELEDLDFRSVRMFCAGLDDVLSDFPMVLERFTGFLVDDLDPSTIAAVNASGKVVINGKLFARGITNGLSSGRHEAIHLLELALEHKLNPNNAVESFNGARAARRIVTKARKEQIAETGTVAKARSLVDQMSTYPAREYANVMKRTTATTKKGVENAKKRADAAYWSEAVATAGEKAYNGDGSRFSEIIFEILIEELGA